MVGLSLLLVAIALGAGYVYLRRERLGLAGAGLAALRTAGLGALVLLIANPVRLVPGTRGPATVLLDASLSMRAAGGAWAAALDTARALAGADGTILRFGARVAPFDTTAPVDGTTRLEPALRAALGRGGPVWVVTDGEVRDGTALPAALRRAAGVVLMPRDTAPGAALLDVAVAERLLPDDSLDLQLELAVWGTLTDSAATVEVLRGAQRLARRPVRLPPPGGSARRDLRLPPGLLPPGTHVLTIRLETPGDREPGDDVRLRVVRVGAVPTIVALVAPADWEGRFLVRELRDVTAARVQGYAQIAPGRWVDMASLETVGADEVTRAAARAALLVVRGNAPEPAGRRPVWRWPAGAGEASVLEGDWYPGGQVPASPLGGRLGTVAWDSVPPLTGVVPRTPGGAEWAGLVARLGRRGPERPVLVGRDSAGSRELFTVGRDAWRWALRGGAAREAYRTLVAAGVDWLLGSDALRAAAPLHATEVVERGLPVVFTWRLDAPPAEGIVIAIEGDTALTDTLRFDANGTATRLLGPGAYRWRAPAVPGAGGIIAVEPYSGEVPPGPVTVGSGAAAGAGPLVPVSARDRWWLFVIVVAALVGEWAWRVRRGLP